MRLLGRLFMVAAVLAPCTGQASAQLQEEMIHQDWARFRANVLAFVEAMPEELFDYRPTEGVRSFSEQIEHIVRSNLNLVGSGVVQMEAPPAMGNPNAYLRSKRELEDFVSRTFDFVDLSVSEASGRLEEDGVVYNLPPMPKWKILNLAREHGVWTLGQLIPYLRLNGIQPPTYALFPGGTGME